MQIIDNAMGFIHDNFGLSRERLDGLMIQLGQLPFVNENEFSTTAIEFVKDYCKRDRISLEVIERLSDTLLAPQEVFTIHK